MSVQEGHQYPSVVRVLQPGSQEYSWYNNGGAYPWPGDTYPNIIEAADGFAYFSDPTGVTPQDTIADYTALRLAASTEYPNGVVVIGSQRYAGLFNYSASDPNGNGDDNGLVIAATDGWWIRDYSITALKSGIDLGWYDTVQEDGNVDALLDQIALIDPQRFKIRLAPLTRVMVNTDHILATGDVTFLAPYTGESTLYQEALSLPGNDVQSMFTIAHAGNFYGGPGVIFQSDLANERILSQSFLGFLVDTTLPIPEVLTFEWQCNIDTAPHGGLSMGLVANSDIAVILGGIFTNCGFEATGSFTVKNIHYDSPEFLDPQGRNIGLVDLNDPTGAVGAEYKRGLGPGTGRSRTATGRLIARYGGATASVFAVNSWHDGVGTAETPLIYEYHDLGHTPEGVAMTYPEWNMQGLGGGKIDSCSNGTNPVYLHMKVIGLLKTRTLYDLEASPEAAGTSADPGPIYKANNFHVNMDLSAVPTPLIRNGGIVLVNLDDVTRYTNPPGETYKLKQTDFINTWVSRGEIDDNTITGRSSKVIVATQRNLFQNMSLDIPMDEAPYTDGANIIIQRASLQEWTRPDNNVFQNITILEVAVPNPSAQIVAGKGSQVLIRSGQGTVMDNITFEGTSQRNVISIAPFGYLLDPPSGGTTSNQPESDTISVTLTNIFAASGCKIIRLVQADLISGVCGTQPINVTLDGIPILTGGDTEYIFP